VSDNKDEKLKTLVRCAIDDSIRYFADRQKNLDRYEGVRKHTEEKARKWDHEYISHVPAEMIENKAAFMTQAIINPTGKMFDVGVYNNIEFSREAKAASELLNYFMSNIPLMEMASKIHRDCFLYGDAIVEVFHKTVMRKDIPQDDSNIRFFVDEEGKFSAAKAPRTEEAIEIKQPYFKLVRLNNFYPDPHSVDGTIESCRYIIKRELKTRGEVKRNREKFGLKNLKEAFEASMPNYFQSVTSDISHKKGLRRRLTEYDVENIKEYNNKLAKEDDKLCEVITIYRPGTCQFMVNNVVVSDEMVLYPGIRYPFVKFPNTPFEGEFFARADLELVANNIEFYEEMVNLMHDKYLLSSASKILADASVFGTKEILEYKKAGSGDIVMVDNFSSDLIKEIVVQPPDASAVAFANNFLQEAKKMLAINPMMEGQNPGSGIRTEGSLQMFQNIGSTRMQTQLGILTKCWEDLGRLMLKMAKIFMDEEVYLAITGPLGDTIEGTITKQEINPDTRFRLKLGSIADPQKNQKIARMMQHIQASMQMDRLGIYRAEAALAEVAAYADDFQDPLNHWEADPEVIRARIELAAASAEKQSPYSGLVLPSPSQAQQGQEEAGAPEPPQTASEGVPQQ
jgi:hypothetical protein